MHTGPITLVFAAMVMLAIFTLDVDSYTEQSTFEVDDNQVIFKENDKVVKILSLKPKTPYENLGSDASMENRRGYIMDEVFYDRRTHKPEYLLIYRNGHYPDAAHVPPINGREIEVYDRKGNKMFVIDNEMGMYSGWHILFLKNWVAIIYDDERMIDGYGFIHMKDQTHKYVPFPTEHGHVEHFIHVFKYDRFQMGSAIEKDVVWVISGIGRSEDRREIITEIASDGSFKRSEVKFE